MQVVSIISTKGGVGKTTTAANLGGFAADTGLRVLLLDLDVQPTLSSYFTLAERAPAGIYEMLAYNEQRAEQLVSRTAIERLDLVLSNDDRGELKSMRVADAFRGTGVGRGILRHILGEAAAMGLTSVWLETGSTPEFVPAARLYESEGFVRCGPFADYRDDPLSLYFTRAV